MLPTRETTLLLCLSLVGCGDTTVGPPMVDGGDSSGAVMAPAPVAPPALGPCPDGWQASEESGGGLVFEVCVPAPTPSCAIGERAYASDATCQPIGTCAAGTFPIGVPSGAVYVDAAAAPGGDGTALRPLSSLARAVEVSPADTVFAVARGTYEGPYPLRPGMQIWGACAAETVLTHAGGTATVSVFDPGNVLRNVTITGTTGAIAVDTIGEVSIEDVQILDTPIGILSLGRVSARGLTVRNVPTNDAVATLAGTQLEITDVYLEGVRRGLFADGAGTTATVHNARIVALPDDRGRQSTASQGASLTIRASVLEQHGASASDAPSALTLEDVVVRTPATQGLGVAVGSGARATVRRTLVDGWSGISLFFSETGEVVLEDVVVRDATSDRGGSLVTRDSPIRIDRVALLRQSLLHMTVSGADADVTGTDLLITEATPNEEPSTGLGLALVRGAQVELERTLLWGNDTGMFVAEGVNATLRDMMVTDNPGISATGAGAGTGLSVFSSQVFLERAHIRNTRVNGIGLAEGAILTATDLRIDGTEQAVCTDAACPSGRGHGNGLVTDDGQATIERFYVGQSALCGLRVFGDGGIDASDGRVASNPLGLCVAGEYDTGRAGDGVLYQDNERNLTRDTIGPPAIPRFEIDDGS